VEMTYTAPPGFSPREVTDLSRVFRRIRGRVGSRPLRIVYHRASHELERIISLGHVTPDDCVSRDVFSPCDLLVINDERFTELLISERVPKPGNVFTRSETLYWAARTKVTWVYMLTPKAF